MLGSHFIFNNDNTHDGLIFDSKGCSAEPQNQHGNTYWRPVVTWIWTRTWSDYLQSCLYIIQRLFWAIVSFSTMATRTMDWYLTQKGAQSPQNQHSNTYLTACRDLKLSQNTVGLPSIMSIHSIETMFGSLFIFNNGNTHNGLIFDQKCAQSPKICKVTPIWRPIVTWNWARTWSDCLQSCLYIV